MKTFGKIILSILVVLLALAGIAFAFVWIMCGGGGVVYFILLLLVFLVVIGKIFRKIGGKKDNDNINKKIIGIDKKNKDMIAYIVYSRKKGLNDGIIIRNLVTEGGGDEDEVINAMYKINNEGKI